MFPTSQRHLVIRTEKHLVEAQRLPYIHQYRFVVLLFRTTGWLNAALRWLSCRGLLTSSNMGAKKTFKSSWLFNLLESNPLFGWRSPGALQLAFHPQCTFFFIYLLFLPCYFPSTFVTAFLFKPIFWAPQLRTVTFVISLYCLLMLLPGD